MILRTKFQDEDFELGEVADVDIATVPDGRIKAQARAERGGLHTIFYKTKAEFDADWEDVPEEPGEIVKVEKSIFPNSVYIEYQTEEEAEKAVAKLKAWKRLKDRGFEFTGLTRFYTGRGSYAVNYSGTPVTISFNKSMDVLGQDWIKDNKKDLDLLFGGEE